MEGKADAESHLRQIVANLLQHQSKEGVTDLILQAVSDATASEPASSPGHPPIASKARPLPEEETPRTSSPGEGHALSNKAKPAAEEKELVYVRSDDGIPNTFTAVDVDSGRVAESWVTYKDTSAFAFVPLVAGVALP